MTKNWARFPIEEPTGEDLSNFTAYRLYERSAIAGYGVLSGCVTSRSSATAVAVSSGVYTVSGVQAAYAGGSLTSISAATAGKQRYDLVYIDGADAALKLCAGVEDTPDVAEDFLENYKPRPAEPTDTDWICLAVVRVTESGIEASNFGTNVYATGSVANLYLSPVFAVDNTTLQVVDGVASVKPTYVKADGTVALSADWDAGSYEVKALKFESDQATGTAPIAVASTTVCSNLNADLLDGNEAAAFLKANGTVALSADWDAGGYEVRALTFESDQATGTAPIAVVSTTVCSNLNADLLDGNEAVAFAVAAKGVTNGDSHDHSGGDGASIPTGSTTFTSTAKVLGRKTTGGGAGEECSVSEVLDMLGTEEQGDMVQRGAAVWENTPHGAASQYWKCGGHGANNAWETNKWGYEVKFGDGAAVITNQSDTSRSGIKACKITKVVIRSTDGAAAPALVADTLTVTLYIHDYDAEEGTAVDTFSLSAASSYLEGSLSHAVAADKWITISVSGASASKCLVVSLEFEAT